MSNFHTHKHESNDGGVSSNGSSFASRREVRASNITGELPALGALGVERYVPGTFDFEQMVHSLHELFEHDRQVASQSDATRCGICYLHFSVSELHYREDGFYICLSCAHTLGHYSQPMLRKQQKL